MLADRLRKRFAGDPVHVPQAGGQRNLTALDDCTWLNCNGQGKTDTELSGLAQGLVFIGTDIPEIRMLPRAVVEHLDGINDVMPRFLPGRILAMGRPCSLETAEEPRGHGVIETVTLAAPTTAPPCIVQEPLVHLTRLLTAPISMVEEPGGGLPPPHRHLPCFLYPDRIHVTAQRLPHHCARRPVQQH